MRDVYMKLTGSLQESLVLQIDSSKLIETFVITCITVITVITCISRNYTELFLLIQLMISANLPNFAVA